ncbi:hypothetical protein ACGFIW_01625 [Micromonospora sp. NPDC048935]|uniref:hypothetical protein n=1 Tax=Micromonospora sp. NPDC048935 TaxID=3364262 RepID=UPI003713E57D
MTTDLNVPAGTDLVLLAGEWFPEPTVPADRGEIVTVVAVYQREIGGRVWVRGHVCKRADPPDCGTGSCFEHQVLTSAIRANVAGAR